MTLNMTLKFNDFGYLLVNTELNRQFNCTFQQYSHIVGFVMFTIPTYILKNLRLQTVLSTMHAQTNFFLTSLAPPKPVFSLSMTSVMICTIIYLHPNHLDKWVRTGHFWVLSPTWLTERGTDHGCRYFPLGEMGAPFCMALIQVEPASLWSSHRQAVFVRHPSVPRVPNYTVSPYPRVASDRKCHQVLKVAIKWFWYNFEDNDSKSGAIRVFKEVCKNFLLICFCFMNG